HHPLMWYLGAPLVGLFEYNLRVVDAVNMLTICITTITMIYIYRINKAFLGGALGGLLAAAFLGLPHESLYNKDFKPDNYMVMGLVVGLYYFLCYIKNKGLFNLSLSFIAFFSAFMFTQKSALILFGVFLIILYLIKDEKVSLKDCIQSGILPVVIYLLYLAYLHKHDILTMYFRANFELNSHIPDVFFTRRYIYPAYETIVPTIISLYGCFRYMYSSNVYAKVIGMCFIVEFIVRLYYFTPFAYYYAFLHAIASIYAGYVLNEIIKNNKKILYFFLIYFIILGGIYAKLYSRRISVGDDYKYGASGYVLRHTTPCDYVLNGYRIGYNLFGKDPVFIWNLLGQIDVIADSIGLYPLADLEMMIRKYRPKFIFGNTYYDTYKDYRGAIMVYPIHQISKQLLNEMYRPLHRDGIYVLKPDYQSYECKYNNRTKSYEYVDKNF
ncbi:MAG: glycosyltransferase family 39 protein, partial [Alphaproteobacteria bacterium]|nr:glycosyltransferase family 39 protein [Alphaproteobacteria bacterium]